MQSTNLGSMGQGFPPPVMAQVPQQPTQPTTPQPTYSSESTMNTTASQENLHKVETILDSESFQILQKVSSIHAQTIVALGIKLFAKTNLYKEFMVKDEHKTLDIATEDIVEETSVAVETSSPVVASSSVSKPTTATPSGQTPGGFTAW